MDSGADVIVKEHAYLVARGVRPLALLDDCEAEELQMLRIATRLETYAVPGAIPFMIDLGNGRAASGFAAARWVIALFKWLRTGDLSPEKQHRVLGLLLGYDVESIRRFEEEGSGRLFAICA